METKYVFMQVNLPYDITFYVDGNSKSTAGNGTFGNPKPNSFSLPHISTCPGATPACMKSCYVHGLQESAPDVYLQYKNNERFLHIVLDSNFDGIVGEVAAAFGKWISENCAHGFRWHNSGDVFNQKYATFIRRVCNASPSVKHWIYTRSFWFVPTLVQASNLVVNISADRINYKHASDASELLNVRLCYFTDDGEVPVDLEEGSVVFPDYNLRGRELVKPVEHSWWKSLSQEQKKMVCPADFFGQSENIRCGVCKKCMKRY